MYKRFKWNPEIRYEEVFYYPGIKGKLGDRYFVGSTMELFGDWIQKEWLEDIFRWVNAYPQRTFIFLTKQPQNLPRKFPDNCWVGVSVTTEVQLRPAIWKLSEVQCNKRFLSCEPLLGPVFNQVLPAEWDTDIDWVIIGQQTPISKKTTPKIEWIKEIVEAADKAGIPVFLKDNLKPLLKFPEQSWAYIGYGGNYHIRQEVPVG